MYGTMIIPTPEIVHIPTLRTMYTHIDDDSNLYLEVCNLYVPPLAWSPPSLSCILSPGIVVGILDE